MLSRGEKVCFACFVWDTRARFGPKDIQSRWASGCQNRIDCRKMPSLLTLSYSFSYTTARHDHWHHPQR